MVTTRSSGGSISGGGAHRVQLLAVVDVVKIEDLLQQRLLVRRRLLRVLLRPRALLGLGQQQDPRRLFLLANTRRSAVRPRTRSGREQRITSAFASFAWAFLASAATAALAFLSDDSLFFPSALTCAATG